jgi:hypothetical protein
MYYSVIVCIEIMIWFDLIIAYDFAILLLTDWLSSISRKHVVSKITGLGRKNLCFDLQKLDNMKRTYDMVTVSKNQTVSSTYM